LLSTRVRWRHPERSRTSGGAKDLECSAAEVSKNMTLAELDNSLPCGFHDAGLKSVTIDYEQRTVSLKFSLKVGNPEGPCKHRDDCRDAQVEITGMIFWIVDPPDRREEFGSAGEVWIGDSCETRSIPQFTRHLSGITGAVPSDAFVHSFFANDWNSYIHVAARGCSMRWLGDAYAYQGRRQAFHPGETVDI
jgi:hypothetical protein